MAFKSIIDIDVNDERFTEFLSKFERFSKDAKDIPEPFQKMDKKIDAARSGFGKLGGHLKRHMRESAGATKDFTVELHHAGQKMATLTARVSQGRKELDKMGQTGRKTFSIIARAGKDIFKAIPFIGGAIAGAGLAAVALYRHQSDDILNRYKAAKIMNMTPGQVSAVDTAYQPVLGNPAQTLSQMRQAEFMPSSASFFARAVGQGWQHMGKMQLYAEAIKRAKELADHTKTSLLGVMDVTRGFSQIGITAADLALLKRTSWATVDRTIANAQKQQKALNFSAKTGRDMSRLAVTISQKEIELSTDLSRTLAKGAPLMNQALNKLVNSVNWAANRINAVLRGMVTGKAPTKGQGPVLDTVGKAYNYLSGPQSKIGKAKMVMEAGKGIMERAKGKSRYAAAKAAYEKELAAYRKDLAAQKLSQRAIPARFQQLPKPVQEKAEQIAKRKGLYLNPANWHRYNDPGDIDPTIVVDGHRINAYEKFKSQAANFRYMARLVRGYPVAHTVLAETRHFEGYDFHPTTAKQIANNRAIDQHAASIAGGMKVGENQTLNLNNASVLAKLILGLRENEQPMQRSPQELYHVIKRAIVDGMREAGSGTPASSVGAQLHLAAH